MGIVRSGDRSPSWRGGRVLASNGYILVKVGVDHHLADVRGYAYEHRVVAEQKLGRRLVDGEIVHHVDHDKTNNAPENLEVKAGIAEHNLEHRGPGGERLQMPGEPNRLILCGCGCGEEFPMFDDAGRPRRFVTGHNTQDAPTEAAVLAALAGGAASRTAIADRIGKSTHAVATALSKLKRKGFVSNDNNGAWRVGCR